MAGTTVDTRDLSARDRAGSQQATAESFSIAEARSLVHDLFVIRPLIFWCDFLLSLAIGYGSAGGFFLATHLWLQVLCLATSALALHRVSNFMHEVVHFRENEMRGFRLTWNLLAGVPMLTPSFFYEPHLAHHNANHYGTERDGEYLPLGRGPTRNVVFFFLQVFVQPILYVVRFALLTPISMLHPRLRQWVLERVSTFGIDWTYRRPIPDDAPRAAWAAIELLCCLRAMLMFALVAAGLNPWYRIPQLYLLAICILSLTYVRTTVAHRFRNEGGKMSHLEQLFDSIDITGDRYFTELLFPLGLRYHALHHLFPGIPYHNLGIAHRRLMAQLPADSAYRRVVYPTFRAAFWELIRSTRRDPWRPQSP